MPPTTTRRNALGVPGAIVADLIMQFFGLAAIALLLPPVVWAWRLVFGREANFGWRTFAYWVGGRRCCSPCRSRHCR